jgi:hypothetical protein
MIKILLMAIFAATAMVSLSCTDKALFNEGQHAWSFPRAFVSDKNAIGVSISDSFGLAKSVSIQAGQPVHFMGLITNPRPRIQLEGRWSFGDGAFAVDTLDTAFIINHVFADSGVYSATFSISENPTNRLSDSVTVTVVPHW